MLQALRNKLHGWPSIVILGICVLAISFFGIESYFISDTDTYVAKIGKQEISQQQYQDRMNQLRQQASAQQGDQFDSSAFEQMPAKLGVLNQMIDEKLLTQAGDDLGMTVSDQAVRDYISSIPAFQLNGQFDGTTYRTVLTMQGKTPAAFESDIRASLAPAVIPDAITGSTIVTDADVDRYIDLRLQRRDVRYIVLPRPAPTDSVVTDVQIAAYYKQHQADFVSPERVSLQYIEISQADAKPDAAPSDADLRKRYAEEKQRFVQPEQRLVSHILINVPKNASPAQQKAALAKAEGIASQATSGNFAKLASADSEDLGSKRQGGDLGWLEKGVATQAFDDAMFGLQKGQISKPVLSDEGYHIIWLRDVRSGMTKPFAEVRDQLVKELQDAGRDRGYNGLAGKLTDKTYQNPASLDSAAQELNLPIKTTGLFARSGGDGLAGNPKVVQAAFSEDVLAQGNNSSLIDLGNSHAVVIRVDKHLPAAPQPLADVRDSVSRKILDERAVAAAKQQADTLLDRLRKGESMDAVAASAKVKLQSATDVVRSQPVLPPALSEKVFALPHPAGGKPRFDEAPMSGGGYAVFALDKVQGADMSKVPAEQRGMLQQQMAKAYGAEATHEFIEQLRSRVDIKIASDRL